MEASAVSPTPANVTYLIQQFSAMFDLDPEIVVRQCQAESNFNQDAVSPAGAIGLFQLMPGTAKELGVDPTNWVQNIYGGVKYLAAQYRAGGRNYEKALAAYNWGPGHLLKCWGEYGKDWKNHLPQETRDYIRKILGEETSV
jgi:soluble lytic murein transglycosylase-like protein